MRLLNTEEATHMYNEEKLEANRMTRRAKNNSGCSQKGTGEGCLL